MPRQTASSLARLALGALPLILLALATAATPWLLRQVPASALAGTYYAATDWNSPPLLEAVVEVPSTDTLSRHEAQRPVNRGTFGATWQGYLVLSTGGRHAFGLVSDDGSELYLDAELVVDNGGHHGPQLATGTIERPAGVYPVLVRYFQDGGGHAFEWLAGTEASSLGPVSPDALSPERAPRWILEARPLLRQLPLMVTTLWALAVVALMTMLAARVAGVRASMVAPLAPVLALAAGLAAWGLGWGLPAMWALDELYPYHVRDAIEAGFAHGWNHWYPPLHFYIVAPVVSVFMLATQLGFLSPDVEPLGNLLVTTRSVTLIMGLGTLVAVYRCAEMMFDRRAGVLAALILTLSLPFSFYSKTANTDVPYVFWLTWSLVMYLRIWQSAHVSDFVRFGALAAAAVCTKDQAYGFYALLPAALLYRVSIDHAGLSTVRRLVASLGDRRLWLAGLAAAVVLAFVYNVPFNLRGAVDHFRVASSLTTAYRMFARTLAGGLGLFGLTVHLLRWSFRWPLFLICAGGLVTTLSSRQRRSIGTWLLLPAVSYFLTFLHWVGFVYDRFLLGLCVILAILGGHLASDLLRTTGRLRIVATASLVLACGYALLSVASLDVMMNRDARYETHRWLRGHVAATDRVGWFGTSEYNPRFDGLTELRVVPTPTGGLPFRPEYLVVNPQVIVRLNQQSRQLHGRLGREELGYREVWRSDHVRPWWAILQFDEKFRNGIDDGATNLDNIDPEIVIYRRTAP